MSHLFDDTDDDNDEPINPYAAEIEAEKYEAERRKEAERKEAEKKVVNPYATDMGQQQHSMKMKAPITFN